MRKLHKGSPIQEFVDCIHSGKPANWEAFSRDHRNVSQEVRLHILCEEQGELCGYTELPISDPSKCHIDHFRKRSMYPALTFDWNNFVVATKDDDFGARYKDLRYGIQKADYGSFLDPVADAAETYFEYTMTGDIQPKQGLSNRDKAIAQKTIDVFNLGDKKLKSRRLAVIDQIQSYSDLSDNDVIECFRASGFKSLIEQLLNERR